MLVIQVFMFGIVLGVVPIIIGSLFQRAVEKRQWIFRWISGQILLWAVFLVLSVPLILLEKSFTLLCIIFNILTVLLVGISLLVGILKKRRNHVTENSEFLEKQPMSRLHCCQWVIFWILLLSQLVLTVFMAYEEGDDAFYIAVSTITESADTMYKSLPYTGMSTGLDARHGLAPFPIWVAYLARISGMAAVTVGQIVLPVVLISMAYGIYYLIGSCLFEGRQERVASFMIAVALLVLFGGYSVYSAENFLLVRASQGKAVIANIVIPFMFYLIYRLLENLQENRSKTKTLWLLLAFTIMAGCLCSTMGTVLTCILLGAAGVCMAGVYGKWKVLLPMAFCCAIPVGMALLYFVLK